MNAPEVWWSPSLAEDLPQGGLIERTGLDLWHQENGLWHRLDELPADAVRLVPATLNSELKVGAVPDTGRPTADARGASIWLGREDWGVVIDALIEHRASAQRRKAGNSESTSDVRGEVCDRIIGDLTGVLAQPYGPAAVPDTGQASVPDNECPACRGSGRDRPLTPEEIAEQTAMTIDALKSPDTGQVREPGDDLFQRILDITCEDGTTGRDMAEEIMDLLPEEEEFVLRPPIGWLNRVDDVLCHHGAAPGHGSHVGEALGQLIRSWRGPRDDYADTFGPGHWGPRAYRAPAEPAADTVQAPDVAALVYARSEVDKWLASADPYCILPTRTEHIPALLARLDELEGTS